MAVAVPGADGGAEARRIRIRSAAPEGEGNGSMSAQMGSSGWLESETTSGSTAKPAMAAAPPPGNWSHINNLAARYSNRNSNNVYL